MDKPFIAQMVKLEHMTKNRTAFWKGHQNKFKHEFWSQL